jgi:hypothetical protein
MVSFKQPVLALPSLPAIDNQQIHPGITFIDTHIQIAYFHLDWIVTKLPPTADSQGN